MKNIIKIKITTWFIALLILANIATLIFYWIGHIKEQKDNSPREFLSKKLNFTDIQKDLYFDLAKEHNESAKKIREEIMVAKDSFFDLLKSDNTIDSSRNIAALKVSESIQALDILTFEHFKKVRALCTTEQKPKFDELIQKMVHAVNSPQPSNRYSIKEDTTPIEGNK